MILLLMLLTCTGPANATNVWDLKADWSETSNPNGPWSLKQGNTLLPHVTAWQSSLGGWTTAQPGWAKSENGNDRIPFWFRSTGTENFTPDSLAGDIVVHSQDDFSGTGNGAANVTWTSPISGVISISGGVWMTREISRSNDWKIYKNGTLLSSGTIAAGDAYNRATPFSFAAGSGGATAVQNIAVTLGDVIKLEIIRASSAGDFAGVNFKISAGSVWNSGTGANGHTYIPVKVPGGITWAAAENAAVAAGGHLVSIDNVQENTFVYSLVSGDSQYWFTNAGGQAIGPWLGGYQTPVGTEPAQGWQWAGGAGFGYTNWAAGQPDNANGGTDDRTIFFHPTAATGSFWNDYPAAPAALDLPHSYIIEVGPGGGNSTVWNTGMGANGHSYEAVLVQGGITWAAAEAAAVSRGGHLTSITSAEENAFVYALVSGRPEFWFNNSGGAGIGPWLGGYQPDGSPEPAGGWKWSDGSAFGYLNWASGEPNDFGNENRASFYAAPPGGIDSRWNDLPPGGITLGYIIEYATTPGVRVGPEFADILYVESQAGNVVYHYRIDPTQPPTFVASLTDNMVKPAGLAFDGKELFIVQHGNTGGSDARVSRFLSANVTPVAHGTITAGSPAMDSAFGAAFRGNELFVVDAGNNRVRRFLPDGNGNFAEHLPAITTGLSSNLARYVTVNPATQEVLVSHAGGPNKILRYLISSGGAITSNGEITGNGISNPHGMVFSSWGELFVTNYDGHTVSRFVFDQAGAAVPNGTIIGNAMNNPVGIAFSPWGELFVGSTTGQLISRFTFSSNGAATASGTISVPGAVGTLQFVSASAPVVPPPCVPGVTTSVTDGLIGWWKGDGNASDYTGNNNGTEENGVTYDAGRFGQAFRVGGSGATPPRVNLGHLPQLKGASAYTLSLWLKLDGSLPLGNIVAKLGLPVGNIPPPPGYIGDNNTRGFHVTGPRLFNSLRYWSFSWGAYGSHLYWIDVGDLFYQGPPKWFHFAGVWRSSDGFAAMYLDGVLLGYGYAPVGVKFPDGIADLAPAYIGAVNWCSGNTITYADNATISTLYDDVRIYTRDLTPEEILLISTGDDFNTCPPPNTGIPPLTAARVPTGVQVSWPARFTGWSLETSTTLTSWTPVTGTPVVENSDFAVTTSATPVRQFFRLRQTK